LRKTFALSVLVALLSACSGGGGSVPTFQTQANPSLATPATTDSHANSLSQARQQAPQVSIIAPLTVYRPIAGDPNTAPGKPELAIAPLNFGPGGALVSGPNVPNARTISNVIAGDGNFPTGTDPGQTTDPHLSAWNYVWGQFQDHDIDLEFNALNAADISIMVPVGDPVFPAGTTIAMTRDTRSPSTDTIVNTTSGCLDLSQLYGSDTNSATSLSSGSDGTMKTSGRGLYLPIARVGDVFVTGDPRVMENPELTALTTLFMRNHNWWAATLKAQHPTWTGTQLYNMARALNIAEYENITYTEFVPHLIGSVLGPYAGYNASANAQVTQEFSTAAFRLHSMVSDTQEGLDNNGNVVFTQPLAQAFSNTPARDVANGVDPQIRALGVDFSQAVDPFTVAALRNLLVAGLASGGVDRMDLIAIDIQRGRDVGLGSLNQTRVAMHMKPYTDFSFIRDRTIRGLYQTTYRSVDNVDLFMGGQAEDHASGAAVGPTFQAIIADQYRRMRDGDRYFWQNQHWDAQTHDMIAHTTLRTLILRNTATTAHLQPDMFVQAPLPAPHVKQHVPWSGVVGRRPFEGK
jgi:peroxidase